MMFAGHELGRAARNLAANNVVGGEEVLVVASSDQAGELVDALVSACSAAGAGAVTAAVIATPMDMRDYRHPPAVIAAAERADLTVVATSIRFPRAYDDLSQALFAAGRRQVLINNAPLADFTTGAALADPGDLTETTRALARRVSQAREVRVTAANGTDLTVRVCRPCLPLTGYAEADTGFGSFPSGEAMMSPEEGTASGTFVADAFGQVVYLSGAGPQLGLLEDPIRLGFEDGRLVSIDGGLAARRLSAVLDAADGNARMLAELGIGTNPTARAIGHVENKFRTGTAHIALGDNHLIGWRAADVYGGTIVSDRHIDLVSDGIGIDADGVRRIVFASSNHAIGFYPRNEKLTGDEPPRPDCRYGLSKVFGESLGQYFADNYGMGVLSIRIGWCHDNPRNARALKTWISIRDLTALCRVGLDTEDLHHEIVWGVSDNADPWWDNETARRLGFRPQDSTDAVARELGEAGRHEDGDTVSLAVQGGVFASHEYEGDPGRVVPSGSDRPLAEDG